MREDTIADSRGAWIQETFLYRLVTQPHQIGMCIRPTCSNLYLGGAVYPFCVSQNQTIFSGFGGLGKLLGVFEDA